jgi:hypothetical protein
MRQPSVTIRTGAKILRLKEPKQCDDAIKVAKLKIEGSNMQE